MLTSCFRRRSLYFLLLVATVFFSTVHIAMAQTTDVFGRTSTGKPADTNVQEFRQNETGPRWVLPRPLRVAIAASVEWQGRLNAGIQNAVTGQQEGHSGLPGWTLVLLSFGYGVLHALGPGHGKLVVSTYLASHRARVAHAFALSVWSASVQAMSAICLVGGAAWLSRVGLSGVLTNASNLELVSYVALFGVGVWTAWSIATRRDCCDDVRVKLVPRDRSKLFPVSRVSSDETNPTYLGARLSPRGKTRRWATADANGGTIWIARQIVMTGLAVGIRPCAGALFVLIAALANGVFIAGIVSAFAMAAGVALTVLGIGLASLGTNRVLSAQRLVQQQAINRIRTRLALAGALFMTVFAAWQALALMLGWHVASVA